MPPGVCWEDAAAAHPHGARPQRRRAWVDGVQRAGRRGRRRLPLGRAAAVLAPHATCNITRRPRPRPRLRPLPTACPQRDTPLTPCCTLSLGGRTVYDSVQISDATCVHVRDPRSALNAYVTHQFEKAKYLDSRCARAGAGRGGAGRGGGGGGGGGAGRGGAGRQHVRGRVLYG